MGSDHWMADVLEIPGGSYAEALSAMEEALKGGIYGKVFGWACPERWRT